MMFDKSFTLKTANDVIKDVIIPNLTSGMAKEQAIALLSVLKNVDTNTIENTKPKEQSITLINQTVEEFLQAIRSDSSSAFNWVEELDSALEETVFIEDVTEKWKQLNEIQCRLLRFLYKENAANRAIESKYIFPLRKRIREQLTIEMALVR
ncbi:hypothetical protein [Neobacillus citreus]|uniref:Uncharacterized protein n=1 Tax=Neobacillus citreus TaxID=2833578 RepID=A0A942SUI8_9BACI|nr:hypothetical protein [Neobacillus citreus]MCH6263964.1 hypothetical protein [Neobacillus citreus]